MKDYYSILGVSEEADFSEIKRAYRSLARKYHPDKNPDDISSEEKFKLISEAHEILSHPQKRERYNMSRRHDAYHGHTSSAMGDIFSNIFNGFDIGSVFGHTTRRTRPRAAATPGDAVLDVSITLDELESGNTSRSINISKNVICDLCHGKGGSEFENCTTCHSSGEVTQDFQQGSMRFRTRSPCQSCEGQGFKVNDICTKCHGNCTIAIHENYDIQITIKKT